MGKKLRVEAEKKNCMYVHGWVVFLKTDSCSAGEETRFQRNLETFTAIGRPNNGPRPISRPLLTCPQFFEVIPLAAPRRNAKVCAQTLLQEHEWLKNTLVVILHSSPLLPFVSTEHTAYRSNKTPSEMSLLPPEKSLSRIGSRESTSILASDGDSPNFVWQATITAAHPDSNNCTLTTRSKNEKVI